MDDETIIALYWVRDEAAIHETFLKYGGLCARIAGNILASREDGEECQLIESLTSQFLRRQKEERRNVFLRRYWYFDSIAEICAATGFSPGKVKSMLYETRRKLRLYLESEGIEV